MTNARPSKTPISTDRITLRKATPDDVSAIFSLIRAIAEYERMSDQVVATESMIRETLFDAPHPAAEVILAVLDQETPIGFALFFHNYSTFLAKRGLYLEDLFVNPEFRGCGIGKRLLIHLAEIAVERKCGRMEWSVLDWNESAICFYESLGAEPMSEWTVFRLTGVRLTNLANNKEY